MRQRTIIAKIGRRFKAFYLKFLRLHDSPAKIALGFGFGVFMGVMPAVGPVAALVAAFLFRVNRPAALLGGFISNSWISVATFFLAVKIGAGLMGLSYHQVSDAVKALIKEFRWEKMFQISVHDVIVPIAIGYLIIALALGVTASAVVFIAVKRVKDRKTKNSVKS